MNASDPVTNAVTLFGVRHHGPGCARSLRKALETLQPDCLVIEGPAGCEPLLTHVLDEHMVPPVAMLSHSVDDPRLAVFYPFAVFSPEWQALVWAGESKVPVHFMDLPPEINLALQRTDAATDEAPSASLDEPPEDAEASLNPEDRPGDYTRDPLDSLARAAGYGDGESWWNHMIEERGDGAGLFDAITQAMEALRHSAPEITGEPSRREAIREAHMRSVIRKVRKEGFARIAVVCGAWHVPALNAEVTLTADRETLKGLARAKAQTTWVPWTYAHLASAGGYGAGIDSPGWYEHLWRTGDGDSLSRSIGWFANVARILREHELDCSSAHLIEAARLAETLAAMHDRPQPGLDELNQATLSAICNGDEMPMHLIAESLMVGNRLGTVPPAVPTVPLHRDVTAQQKRLRLKPQASARQLNLDLRKDFDLQRSHLLHRLALLEIGWGTLNSSGRSARGTFHEIWELAWQPSHEIDLIVASRYGHTLEFAATAKADETARRSDSLAELTALVDRVLLADLPEVVAGLIRQLDARATADNDPLDLLAALPSLANTYRYGNVRKTDASQVGQLFDGIVLRACISLPLALVNIDEDAAEAARSSLLGAEQAIRLRDGAAQRDQWQRTLQVIAASDQTEPLIRGLATRLVLDAEVISHETVRQQLLLNMSAGEPPSHAARWLDGFLNRSAAVLLHSDLVWPLIDSWLSGLSEAHFVHVLPLVRRSFAAFEAADRRDLGIRATHASGAHVTPASSFDWNLERAERVLPTLYELFGLRHEP